MHKKCGTLKKMDDFHTLVIVLVSVACVMAFVALILAFTAHARLPANPEDDNYHVLVANRDELKYTDSMQVPKSNPDVVDIAHGLRFHEHIDHHQRAKERTAEETASIQKSLSLYTGAHEWLLGSSKVGLEGLIVSPIAGTYGDALWKNRLCIYDKYYQMAFVIAATSSKINYGTTVVASAPPYAGGATTQFYDMKGTMTSFTIGTVLNVTFTLSAWGKFTCTNATDVNMGFFFNRSGGSWPKPPDTDGNVGAFQKKSFDIWKGDEQVTSAAAIGMDVGVAPWYYKGGGTNGILLPQYDNSDWDQWDEVAPYYPYLYQDKRFTFSVKANEEVRFRVAVDGVYLV